MRMAFLRSLQRYILTSSTPGGCLTPRLLRRSETLTTGQTPRPQSPAPSGPPRPPVILSAFLGATDAFYQDGGSTAAAGVMLQTAEATKHQLATIVVDCRDLHCSTCAGLERYVDHCWLEERTYETEAAIADVIAVRNALDEQGLLARPELMLDVKLSCFEE